MGRLIDIAGNRYRLIVRINHSSQTVFVRFGGTHGEHDRVDAEEI